MLSDIAKAAARNVVGAERGLSGMVASIGDGITGTNTGQTLNNSTNKILDNPPCFKKPDSGHSL